MKKINYLLVTTLFTTTLTSCANSTASTTSNTSSKETVCDSSEVLLTKFQKTLTQEDYEESENATITYEYDDGKVTSYVEDAVYSGGDTFNATTKISYLDDGYHYEYSDSDDYYIEYDYDSKYNRTREYVDYDNEKTEVKYSNTYNKDGKVSELLVEGDYKLVYSYDEDGYISQYDEYSYEDGEYTYTSTLKYEYNDDHTKLTLDYDGMVFTYYFGKVKSKIHYPLTNVDSERIVLREVEELLDEDDGSVLYTYVTDYTYEGCGKTYQYEE